MRHGYGAVSMSDIVAEIAKVRPLTMTAIYYHFANKEALYLAVALHALTRDGSAVAHASATEGDVRTRIHAVAEALARATPQTPQHNMRMHLDVEEYLSPDVRERVRQAFVRYFMEPVVAVFAQAEREGTLRAGVSPHEAAFALLSLISGLVGGSHYGVTGDVATIAADMLLEGVLAP